MNRLFIIVLFWVMGLNALAQTQGIAFEPVRSWKKVVEKARKESKLVFVDCYADHYRWSWVFVALFQNDGFGKIRA